MGTNAHQIARSIDVTGLSEDAIRAVESLVVLLRQPKHNNEERGRETADPASFERDLSELSEGLPTLSTLPDDFSRADIYGEHP
jgi:hypothetical protein